MIQGLELPPLWPAILFGVAMLAGVISAVVFSGHFPLDPAQIGSQSLRGRKLALAMLGIATLSILGVAGSLGFDKLPWYAAILIGGLAVLAGPLVEQLLPLRFRSDTVGLCIISSIVLALAGAILTRA